MSANQKVNLLPGDYLFREGEFGQTAYLIDEGTIELVKFTGDQQTVLAELEKGALFGEMAIIENSARSASARAKTNCTLSIITEDKLKKHLSSSPNVALDMMRKLAFAKNWADNFYNWDIRANEWIGMLNGLLQIEEAKKAVANGKGT